MEQLIFPHQQKERVVDRNELIANSLVNFLVDSFTTEMPHANELIFNSPHHSNGTTGMSPSAEGEDG
jgi:hypothetical protein